MNATSLDPPNTTRVLVNPSTVRASTSPKIVDSCARVCAAHTNAIPNARSLAIRVRSVGSGAVEGISSRHASIGGHNRPQGVVFASCRAVSRTCSATAVSNGDADAYGSSRPSR